ncbi:MAG: 16S rRNA (cytidine(1402)-2'-O)-methyltransferase [Elusimicrobia bacterium CG06_land_8_20_14_3_00_38_11]|nr:MAG: 16S rRNA (cytidine(1402)-2'-O)-methyltransferase [Elusimicrobia bacterium CG06_land_8_20_14_3_00_38_11]
MSGVLYVVATPIGHLKDITLRALETLKAVDLIACEDTRRTKILLVHHYIATPQISFYSQNQFRKIPYLIDELKKGKNVALVSDAGTPGISDPGFFLVKKAIEQGIKVETIPGVSAVITALSASGLPTDGFVFLGFLPRKKGKIKKVFEKVAGLEKTIIFYESPYRLKKTLKIISEIFPLGSDIVVCRELTKKFEEFIRGNASDIIGKLPEKILGEITVVISTSRIEAHE